MGGGRRRPPHLPRPALALALALLGLTGASVGGAPPAGAQDTTPSIGIADQAPQTFSDPRFAWLGMTTARLVVPWDVLASGHNSEALRAREWLAAARAAGVRPLVVFDHSNVSVGSLPSPARYRRLVRAFMTRYPWVTDYTSWNEENHSLEPTSQDPRRAAAYFNVLSAMCPACSVVAADVLDEPNMAQWVRSFLRFARHPRLWGLHNYFDLNHGGHARTSLLLSIVPGQLWFTETGGVVWRYDRVTRRFVVRGEAFATRAARRLLGLAALSPRIGRIYYYHWRQPVTLRVAHHHPGRVSWDSGLVRPDCSARPAFGVIAAALGRDPALVPETALGAPGRGCVPARHSPTLRRWTNAPSPSG